MIDLSGEGHVRWFDVLPKHVAAAQHYYERSLASLRMVELGFTLDEIAAKLRTTKAAVHEIIRIAKRKKRRSPLELYLCGDVAADIEKRDRRLGVKPDIRLARSTSDGAWQ